MRYIQKENTLFAIDKETNIVWEVRPDLKAPGISKLPATQFLLELITRDAKTIDAELFQAEFSQTVQFFHNETPFA